MGERIMTRTPNTKQKNQEVTFALFLEEGKITNPQRLQEVINLLHYQERTLQRLCVRSCKGEISEEVFEKKSNSIEAKVKKLSDELGIPVDFQYDPRGYTIMFNLPSGKKNSWSGSWVMDW